VNGKFTLIYAEKGSYPVSRMCVWLTVSRAGYYEWLSRPDSAAARRRATLRRLIGQIFTESRGTYGARRVAAVLVRSGYPAGVVLVARLMRLDGLVACQPRPYKRTTVAGEQAGGVPDRVERDFTAAAPGVKLVGDITYLRTWSGWCYLATVIDCCTHRVVGWSMATHMRSSLISAAVDMAATNVSFAADAVFHSDRGSQYTSAEFAATLAKHGLLGSMGRTGICWDNAMAESFFAALKNELVYRTAFPTPRHAQRAVAEYIEVFYNRKRLHSSLGYRTPLEIEESYRDPSIAA
jgi:putative transposase